MDSLARRLMQTVFAQIAPVRWRRRGSDTLRVEALEAREVPSAAPDFYWKLDEAGGPGVAGHGGAPDRVRPRAAKIRDEPVRSVTVIDQPVLIIPAQVPPDIGSAYSRWRVEIVDGFVTGQ